MSGKTSSEERNVCPQKVLLLEAYEATTEQHRKTIAEFSRRVGISTRIEYVVMYRAAEILRKDAADLRAELEWHTSQHR